MNLHRKLLTVLEQPNVQAIRGFVPFYANAQPI